MWKLIWRLPSLIRLVRRLLVDGRIPALPKIVFCLSLAYVAWPLDLIPDFALPLLGQVDDVAVLLTGLRTLLNQTPAAVLEEHLAKLS